MTRGFDIVFIKILSVITITLLLNACALISPRGPQDLQLVSLEKSRDNPEYFTIKFSSNSDLLEFAISNDYWMYGVEFVGCNHDREEVEYIWWHDIHIRSLGLDSAPYISEPQKQERPHIYEADFPTRNPGMWDGTIVDPDEPIFNLKSDRSHGP